VSEGSRVETGTHRSESREICISSAVGISGLQAGEDVNMRARRLLTSGTPAAPRRRLSAAVAQELH
jgi:hypothetical protein